MILKYFVTLMICLFCATASFATGALSDPMSVGVGARALGMGKTYVAVAEDGDTIFMNPAGLGRITAPKLSTMYTSLLGDVSYVVIGGAYPLTDNSAIGAGIVNSSVAEIPLTSNIGAPLGTGTWGNSVMFLSYGTSLNNYIGRDVLVGGSLKYFNVGGNAPVGVNDAAGSGLDVDLGVLVPVTNAIVVGANVQNALPASLGGKITKTTGIEDSIPYTAKVGTKITVMGKDNALIENSSRKLYANVDYDYQANGETAIHTGVEFWPTNNLALRAGSDAGDLTAGVGVRFQGMEFNYAYHPYSGINENTTQYFSIGYLGESKPRQLRVKIDSPVDKSIIYDDHVNISGKVEVSDGDADSPAGPISIKVNGTLIPINVDNTFSSDVPVEKYGKKNIDIEANDATGLVAKQEVRLVRLTSFADVPDGFWAKMPIENNATVGLIEGYPDKTFRPETALTRAELATMLVRARGLKVPEGEARQVFKDVKNDFWAAKYIEIAQREGMIQGYPDKTFRPNNKISKIEGIAVLARFDDLKLGSVNEKPYWDISRTHWGAKYVQAAKEAGMLKFVERNRLHPKDTLVRAEAVDMFAKTTLAGGKVKDLYTWEKGFQKEETKQPVIKGGIEPVDQVALLNL